MATHDADKTKPNPADRRTMTTDPRATSGPVVESPVKDQDGNHTTMAGSKYLTTNIDGKWYVCNTRGEPFDINQPFATESEARAEAARHEQSSGADAKPL